MSSSGAFAQAMEDIKNLARSLAPGHRLPTIRELSVRSGLSHHSIQRVLSKLAAEGLVTTHVGRGTFVAGGQQSQTIAQVRSVLTLLYQVEYLRGDLIAQIIHQQLTTEGHKSAILTYTDAQHAAKILRNGPRYDGCILQPRTSIVPVSLLALLRDISKFVIVESRAMEQVDIDAVSLDPFVCCQTVLQHLTQLGHRRIAWILENRGDYLFERALSLFRMFRSSCGLAEEEAPVVRAPQLPGHFGFADLSSVLWHIFRTRSGPAPTAVILATFESAAGILGAFDRVGLSVPNDVSLVRIGSPDIEADHLGRVAIVGRPSRQAAESVLRHLRWRWENPDAPFLTIYDPPSFDPYTSTTRPAAT